MVRFSCLENSAFLRGPRENRKSDEAGVGGIAPPPVAKPSAGRTGVLATTARGRTATQWAIYGRVWQARTSLLIMRCHIMQAKVDGTHHKGQASLDSMIISGSPFVSRHTPFFFWAPISLVRLRSLSPDSRGPCFSALAPTCFQHVGVFTDARRSFSQLTPLSPYSCFDLLDIAASSRIAPLGRRDSNKPAGLRPELKLPVPTRYDDEWRNREINNGRFAMFAAIGIIAAENETGTALVDNTRTVLRVFSAQLLYRFGCRGADHWPLIQWRKHFFKPPQPWC